MRVSNVNKFILAAVLELGDIIGAKVTRWRTYARFLDNGETPDPNAHYAPDIYYVQQKTAHTREGFEFTLSSALDLPGIKLPRRQILKDQSSNDRNLYAPGVANVRFRGR
jgi:lambda family phage minor tail protein L